MQGNRIVAKGVLITGRAVGAVVGLSLGLQPVNSVVWTLVASLALLTWVTMFLFGSVSANESGDGSKSNAYSGHIQT